MTRRGLKKAVLERLTNGDRRNCLKTQEDVALFGIAPGERESNRPNQELSQKQTDFSSLIIKLSYSLSPSANLEK
jgi:hypothetical protein